MIVQFSTTYDTRIELFLPQFLLFLSSGNNKIIHHYNHIKNPRTSLAEYDSIYSTVFRSPPAVPLGRINPNSNLMW